MSPTEKLQKRAAIYEDMKKLDALATEEKRKLSADEQKQWDVMDADYVRFGEESRREERLAEFEKKRGEELLSRTTMEQDAIGHNPKTADDSVVTERDKSLAFHGWCLNSRDLDLSDEQAAAAKKLRVNLNARELRFNWMPGDYGRTKRAVRRMVESRADQSTSGGVGGEFIPEGFIANVELSLLMFGSVRSVANVIRTATGADMPWPTVDDTGNVGELLAENAAAASQQVTTAAITLVDYKYSSKLVLISTELLQDSAIDFPALLGNLLGERIARITNQHFTTGTNSSQPQGIATVASGVTAAGTTAITQDEVIDLLHSVDPAYRDASMGTGWMMKDATAKIIRKLKDGNANYVWQGSMMTGMPDVIFGFPVHINQDMPAATTGLKSIVFGALKKYIVRDIANLRLRRLVERYAEKDQDGFVAFSRHDGRVLDAGTDPVKTLIMQ